MHFLRFISLYQSIRVKAPGSFTDARSIQDVGRLGQYMCKQPIKQRLNKSTLAIHGTFHQIDWNLRYRLHRGEAAYTVFD